MRFSRPLVFLAAALSLSAQGLSNRRAPSFSLPDSALRQHDILDYRGTWLLVDFTETSPAKCKELSIKLEGVKKKHGAKVNVLSIVLAPPETQASVAKLVAETKMTTPVLFDSSQVAIAYFKATPQNPSFDSPHLFAINPNGMIVKDWTQAATMSPGFLAELDQLIAGTPAKK
ncbi:MAG TPA: redoxin domain-containing protein [Bryobacteraceae bacterium]|nr:redoxin domain-containing protein [Bryobacteraceae bacterium]